MQGQVAEGVLKRLRVRQTNRLRSIAYCQLKFARWKFAARDSQALVEQYSLAVVQRGGALALVRSLAETQRATLRAHHECCIGLRKQNGFIFVPLGEARDGLSIRNRIATRAYLNITQADSLFVHTSHKRVQQ